MMMYRLVGLLMTFIAGAPLAAQAPVLRAEPASWAFGKIDEGAKARETITLHNPGKAAVRIRKVDSGCGCIDAEVESRTIEPGGSVKLTLSIRSDGTTGPVVKKVRLETAATGQPKLEIPVTGTIDRRWWTSTRFVSFGTVRRGDAVFMSFAVEVRPGLELEPPRLMTSEHVTVTVSPYGKVAEKHGWIVTARLSEKLPTGPVEERVTIEIPGEIPSRRVVGIGARVIGHHVVQPDRIAFGRVRAGESRTIRVEIRHRGGPIGIERLESPHPDVTLVRDETVEPPRVRLLATWTPARGERIAVGRLRIHLSRPEKEVVEIPFRGTVSRR